MDYEHDNDFNILSSSSLSDSSSDNELSGESEGESVPEGSEVSDDTSDYSVLLGDILSSIDVNTDEVEYLQLQLDNLNENVVTLNNSLKIGVALLFCVCVFLVVKIAFAIFNKFLGLGDC